MTWNIELAIEKNNLTFDQIKSLVIALNSAGYNITQMNIKPHI